MITQDHVGDDHYRVTYEEIHCQIFKTAKLIKDQFVSHDLGIDKHVRSQPVALPSPHPIPFIPTET